MERVPNMESKEKKSRFEIGEQAVAEGKGDGRLVEITNIERTPEGKIVITGQFPSFPEVSEEVSEDLRANGLEVNDEMGIVRGPQEKFGKLGPVILRGLVREKMSETWEDVKDKFRRK